MAFRVRKPNIFNGMNIDGMPHVPDCSDLYQVWKLEYNSTTGFYMIRSALETGSNQWTLRLSAIANRPRIYQYPGEPWASSIWKLDAVPGTELYTIYQPNPHLGGNVRYTGVVNDLGINLDLVAANSTVSEQRWGFVRCPV
ncbi:hypothetical protein Fcan01_17400 [Folsomia candida]|uniref:Ricin B lectin domain-containing protein n=2 Tax=Folsomia candida TaxID=158441 RepID=A0A226DSB7_FOLCA|nr:hypothetical protein Fcan01_17400 [Folsomia candida]